MNEIDKRKSKKTKMGKSLVNLSAFVPSWQFFDFLLSFQELTQRLTEKTKRDTELEDRRKTSSVPLGDIGVDLSWQSLRAATRNPVEALKYE